MNKKSAQSLQKNSFTKEEMVLLLEINKAITRAKTAAELLATIREKVMQVIPFYDTGILIVEKDGVHHYDLAVNIPDWDNSEANVLLQQQTELFKVKHTGSYTEFVMSQLEKNNTPSIENWEYTFEHWEHPFFPVVKELGYKEAIVGLLKSGGGAFGTLWLNSKQEINFKKQQFPLFEAVAEQVSIAVANIIANEEIVEREKEKTQLLEISEAVATAQNTKELLKIIYKKIKRLLPYDNAGLFILSKEQDSFYEITDAEVLADDIQAEIHLKNLLGPFSLTGIAAEFWFNYTEPAVTDFELQASYITNTEGKKQFDIAIAHGLKELIGGPLLCRGKKIGMLCFNSKQKNFYQQKHISLFKSISDLIAIAMANILASEEIIEKEREKTILLSISEAVATIRDKKELLKFVFEKVKPLFGFYDAGFFVFNRDKQWVEDWTVTMPEISPSNANHQLAERNNKARILFEGSALQPFYNELRGIKKPAIAYYDEALFTRFAEYPQLDVIKEVGYKESIGTLLRADEGDLGILFFNSLTLNHFSNTQFSFFQGIADQLATAVANILANEEIIQREQEKSTLLNISNAISKINDKVALLKSIDELLWPLFHHDDAGFSIVDKEKKAFVEYYNLYSKEIPHSKESKYLNGIVYQEIYDIDDATLPYAGSLVEYYMNRPPEMGLLKDVLPLNLNPELIQLEIEHGLCWFICSPLKVAGSTIGLFNLLFKEVNKPTAAMLGLFSQIAEIMAMAMSNILAHEELLEREQEKTKLLSITQAIANIQTKKELIDTIEKNLQPLFRFDEYSIAIVDEKQKNYKQLYTDGLKLFSEVAKEKGRRWTPIENDPHELLYLSDKPATMLWDRNMQLKQFPEAWVLKEVALTNLQQNMVTPLIYGNRIIGNIEFMSLKVDFFTPAHFPLFEAVAIQIAAAVKNILANEEIILLNKQLQAQNEYLIEEVEGAYNFEEMIGQNQKFKQACKNIGLVAKTDSSVLILGETGTGKELVARAIHNYSPRKNKPLIKLNCAALPANLIESELFGHERGAFTGAIERRIGKFELANGSTLFLDEIGELPLELQAKLLRALQEKEVERLGSNKVIPIDVRIIAATNRELMKEVQAAKFRQDLYYRLHIFPITLPPLRERKEDIPLLASHFIQKYAKKIGKNIQGLSHTAMQEMMSYNWPGNIRELEHVIERATILAKSKLIQELDLPVASKNKITATPGEFVVKPWLQQERDYILDVLKVTNGNVKGKGGAAELLALPPTTLQSKMSKLGIKRKHYIEP